MHKLSEGQTEVKTAVGHGEETQIDKKVQN
jgi:hypothetical protein